MSLPWTGLQRDGRWRAVLATLLLPASVATADAADAATPREVLRRFVEAMNRHDVDAQYAQYADDMVYLADGRRIPPDRERERTSREFEAASGASWSFEVVSEGPDRVTAVLSEDMEYYRALGSGPRSSRRELRVRDAKIVEMSASNWTQAGRPYQGAQDLFTQWLVRERSQAASRLVREGRLVFDGRTGALLAPLAREWRASQPCRLYHASLHPREPWLLFASDCDGRWNVYVARADGSQPRRLTDNAADARQPCWSPDGRRVAFHSDRDGNWEVYTMAADGTDVVRLTDHPAADTGARYSPDGRRIAWTSQRDGSPELYRMELDGSASRRLTSGTSVGFAPAWAPDGSWLLRPASRRPGAEAGDPLELYRLGPGGEALGVLPGEPRREYNHAFSPDGRTIAYDAHALGAWESDDGLWEIWLMNADGGGRRRLTHDRVNDWGPAFSPDGRTIVFLSGSENVYDIHAIDVDGGGRRRLTRWTANPD